MAAIGLARFTGFASVASQQEAGRSGMTRLRRLRPWHAVPGLSPTVWLTLSLAAACRIVRRASRAVSASFTLMLFGPAIPIMAIIMLILGGLLARWRRG